MLIDINKLLPDALLTVDGAIVTVGRNCEINKLVAEKFIDFVIDFVLKMRQSNLNIRASVNYSEKDRIITINDFNSIQGECVQVGDTANLASIIITFAEIGEIIFNKSVYEFLRKVGLTEKYSFIENEPVITKHSDVLDTYSYNPNSEGKEYLYDPTSPEHQYKKYNYFPAISGEIVKYFLTTGLEFELKKNISNAFESVRNLNSTHQLISYSSVINVLTQLNYDPEDTVYSAWAKSK